MKLLAVLALFALLSFTDANPAPNKKGANQICHKCPEECFRDNCTPSPCTDDAPYCATIISGPNYTTILTCALERDQRPCQLSYAQQQQYELVCYCEGNSCNFPFTEILKDELKKFAAVNVPTPGKELNYFDKFKKQSIIYKDIADAFIYRYFTTDKPKKIKISSNDDQTNLWRDMPVAEALRHETTVPSDDEDDIEGSGLSEDRSSVPPPIDPTAPPEPSTRLPAAADSAAPPININLLPTTLVLIINLLFYAGKI